MHTDHPVHTSVLQNRFSVHTIALHCIPLCVKSTSLHISIKLRQSTPVEICHCLVWLKSDLPLLCKVPGCAPKRDCPVICFCPSNLIFCIVCDTPTALQFKVPRDKILEINFHVQGKIQNPSHQSHQNQQYHTPKLDK